MASPSFSNLNVRPPSNSFSAFSARTTRDPPVGFAGFQFKTIGQQPELLKRISAPDPDAQYDHDSGLLSPSYLSSDQSIQTPPLTESDSANKPSLRDRLSLLQSPEIERGDTVDVTMADPLEISPPIHTRSAQNMDVSPMATSTNRPPDSDGRTDFLQNRILKKEPGLSQDMITTMQEQAIRTTTEQGATSTSDESQFPITSSNSETQAPLSPLLARTPSQVGGTSGVSILFSSGEDVHSLMALRTLQARLSASLSNFNPISTANALAAAQSAKDQCTEILATAHRAHTLAQQASSLAQDSMVATQECLNIATTIQNRADLALAEVEKIRSVQGIGLGGEWEYNATVRSLKDDLNHLAEWVRQRDAYESKYLRQLEEDKIEKRKKDLTLQLERGSNIFTASQQSHNLHTHSKTSSIQTSIHEVTVEDEADAATRAWNQHCEQIAERKRIAEEELRKRREAESELERQRLEAQSQVEAHEAELEKLRAERLKAEKEEKARQEKETLELQRQQHELEITRFLQNQKQAQDNQVKMAAEEKKKAQVAEAQKEARLIAEQEQKRRELHQKEMLKRQEIEKAKALLAETEAKRREKVILERMKRLAVEAQQPVVPDTVTSILDKAKEKQAMANSTTDNRAPLSQHTPLPSSSTHQPLAPSGPNHPEFGNIVSKQTLLTTSPRTRVSMQPDRTHSGGIRLDESSGPANSTSSISSIPTSSTPMQEGSKSQELASSVPPPTGRILPSDNSFALSSSQVDRKSRDGVRNIDPLKPPPSLSPLTPLSEGNSSVPTVHISNSPVASLNDFEDIHAEQNIHSGGSDIGNLSVVPPSRVPPVSLEAQRANLRPFMDANGISCGPGSSNIDKPKASPGSADQPSDSSERSRRKPISSSQMNGNQMHRTSSTKPESMKKPKLEPLNDVPILTMPTPPIDATDADPPAKLEPELPKSKKTNRIPSTTETSLNSKELPASPQTMPPSGLFTQLPAQAVAQLDSLSLASIAPKDKVRTAAVRRNVPPLANNGQEINQANVSRSASPRMGPDAAVTDGWAQPVAMVDDLTANRPRKQPPQKGFDRFSPPRRPSVNSQNRLPPVRPRGPLPRAGDHYSPPRPSHNDYSGDRRRSGSVEYMRPLSPQPTYNEDRRSLSPMDVPLIGRKRYRDDDSVVVPPPRRYRYDSPPSLQEHNVQPSYQPPDVDRSYTATYARSPSPESRLTPLALRLESERPWNVYGGSSYRPTYNNTNPHGYDPQNRSNKNNRHVPQGSSYYGDASAQPNQQRQPVQNDNMNDIHLPLLSRFTDSTEQTYNHHGPPRPRSFRGSRGGGNQTLEHRIWKPKPVSLINRLEDAS